MGAFLDYHAFVVAHRKEDLGPDGKVIADPVEDLHEVMDVKRYRMDLEIPNLDEINIDVDVTFVPDLDGMNLVAFNLVNDTWAAALAGLTPLTVYLDLLQLPHRLEQHCHMLVRLTLLNRWC